MMESPSSASQSVIDRSVALASIVVIALSASVVLFALIGTMVAAAQPRGPVAMPVAIALVAAAFVLLVASVVFRRASFQPERLFRVHSASGDAGLAQQLVRATIVSGSLAEAVGIVGLILGILTGDTYYLYALCAVSLLGVLSNFPRAGRWRDLSAEISKWAHAGNTGSSPGDGEL